MRCRKGCGLRRILIIQGFGICGHIAGDDCPLAWSYDVLELARPLEQWEECADSLGSCPVCLTDYAISISQDEAEELWCVEVVSYQQLGACRSPYDWKWRSLAEKTQWNEPRCLAQDPGLVQQRWICAEGLKCPPRGDYLGKPDLRRGCLLGSRRCPWDKLCWQDPECEHRRWSGTANSVPR
ncbi:hypothetical protein FGRMN_4041 [Fusarium graminum]|nr:hypothetical protein FGRMN_4041 [Fusarium graminum]